MAKGKTSEPTEPDPLYHTINEYIYCGNMPFYYYDPNGLFWHIAAGALMGGAVTGGVTAAIGNLLRLNR